MATTTRALFHMRSYQRELREARQAGAKRFICLWHRRAGKDRNALAFCLEEMLKRTGVYFHIFPSLNQGRRDLWDNIVQERRDGEERSVKMLSMFPTELLAAKPNETEMQIVLKNGSIYQVMGADNDEAVERLRGPNPVGLIFSEYAHGNKMPNAWRTLAPVLRENGGWALFVYTPNGQNHGYDLWTRAQNNPHWFVSKKTIEDTVRDAVGEDGSPVIAPEDLQQERLEGRSEEYIQQEYYCSFKGFQHGTYYGDLLAKADAEQRIGSVPYISSLPVGACLDLGHSDAMACWFYQNVGNAFHFVDYWEERQKNMADWVHYVREQTQYVVGRIVLPWDGRGQAEYLQEVRFSNIRIAERSRSLITEIELVRRMFSRFYFDRGRCSRGLAALTNYRSKYDEIEQVASKTPVHSRWSHGADALRTGVIGGFLPLLFAGQSGEPLRVETDFDPRRPW